jgi:male-specific lethal 3
MITLIKLNSYSTLYFFSWDRTVASEKVLKDNAENRKLQRDLAEKSQLQLGAYLYRKERKKRKRILERNLLLNSVANSDEQQQQDQQEIEYSSSATESHDDDRVFLHMGDVLKAHLEYDFKQISQKVAHMLPAKLPIVKILENFVCSHAIKVFTGPQIELPKPKKRRSSILPGKKVSENKNLPDCDSLGE